MDDWNTVAAPLHWKRETPDYGNFDPTTCPASRPYRKNAIHLKTSLEVGFSAEVHTCFKANGAIHSAQMTFLHSSGLPSGLSWHFDPYTQPAWNERDVRSVATHEWGHMNGQMRGGTNDDGHWWESQNTDLCPDVGDLNYWLRESMCPSVDNGQTVQRVPAIHEIQLIQAAY